MLTRECADIDDDDDNTFAIVQASNFSTLFLLSRQQNPPSSQIDVRFVY